MSRHPNPTAAQEAALDKKLLLLERTERFVFYTDIPAELRQALDLYIPPLEFLIPKWCQNVYIAWASEGAEGAAAVTRCRYQYRWARIVFYANWLEQPPRLRMRNCVHEMVHVNVNPLFNTAITQIEILTKGNDHAQQLAFEPLREKIESVTEDLTDLLMLSHPVLQEYERELTSTEYLPDRGDKTVRNQENNL
jgi:hypothetical protein